MGGGGGDNYERQAAQLEERKQRSRDALNVMFGVAPGGGRAPSRGDFTTSTPGQYVYDSDTGQSNYQGGGSSFDQSAYNRALLEFQNQQRQANQNATGRTKIYDTVRQNAFTAGKRGLDENRERAGRENKFALFAQGLNGGSVDIDENALLGRTYDQGVLDLGAKADAARTGLRSNDEQTRLSLLQSIDAGMDQGSALSSALNQLSVNNDRALAEGQGTSLGDLFGDAGLLYTRSTASRGRQDAQNAWGQTGYPTRPRSTNSGSSGLITSV